MEWDSAVSSCHTREWNGIQQCPLATHTKLLEFLGKLKEKILHSITWAPWVAYFAFAFQILALFAGPGLQSIVFKHVGPTEHGKAQGCITGLCSFASIVALMIFSPLTALFLSDKAPFLFPGFSIVCAAFAIIWIHKLLIQQPQNRHKCLH